jgi:hypothetical protein
MHAYVPPTPYKLTHKYLNNNSGRFKFLSCCNINSKKGGGGRKDLALIFELHPSLKENMSCPELHSSTHHTCNTN